LKDLLELLGAMAGKKSEVADTQELFLDMADRVVKAVSQAFACKTDEVAILMVTADSRHLRFAAPRKFCDLGTIPVTKRDSIAVNVLGKKAGEAMNNVPMVKHVAFFETVKLRDKDKAVPIQKMITVPILNGDDAVGVAQISRKGESPQAAGPDFGPADVRRAQEFFQAVAPHLLYARPDRF
jgi:GAF domain